MTEATAMTDETRQVLEMLAEGKVTPEQAAKLLDAMDDRPARQAYPPPPPTALRTRVRRRRAHSTSPSPLQQLAQARLQGVSTEYVQEMREAGYDDLTLEELTTLRALGVDGDFVAELRDMGFTDLNAEDLAELKVSGINAEYVREMGALGYLHAGPSEESSAREAAGMPHEDEVR
jgi:hypothetical protein